MNDQLQITVRLRDCWVVANDLRKSATQPGWTQEPTLHAIVLEYVRVPEGDRQHGTCKKFIEWLCGDARYDLVIVEGVQSDHLATALRRWGWPHDKDTKDYYFAKSDAAKAAVSKFA